MPSNLVKTKPDEKKWNRAKEQVKKQGKDPEKNWSLVNYIYQKMKESKSKKK